MHHRERTIAVELARKAGREVLALYRKGADVQYLKNQREPVTEADLVSNDIILSGLRQAFPDDAILSEEKKDDSSRLEHDRVWIVDPLDGTREFVDETGDFVVMIGLAVGGEPTVGVVYQPLQDRLWHADVGGFAKLAEPGGERVLQVSGRTTEDGVRLVLTRSHRFEGVGEIKAKLGIGDVRRLGSVGLKVGAIACNDADLYVHISHRTKEWDSCAPDAIVRAAGGRMTDLSGQPLRYNKRDVRNRRGLLASNGRVHDRAVEVVRPLAQKLGVLPD